MHPTDLAMKCRSPCFTAYTCTPLNSGSDLARSFFAMLPKTDGDGSSRNSWHVSNFLANARHMKPAGGLVSSISGAQRTGTTVTQAEAKVRHLADAVVDAAQLQLGVHTPGMELRLRMQTTHRRILRHRASATPGLGPLSNANVHGVNRRASSSACPSNAL